MSEKAENQQELLKKAMKALHDFVLALARQAGKDKDYAEALWTRISQSEGVLKELAYYYDTGDFWCGYQVAGYTLADILVWQVDHFKAYMDRHMEMNRYRKERLLLESLEVLLQMEKDPAPFVAKMREETGTDR